MQLLAAQGKARLKVWTGFATSGECAELVELARPRLMRSTVLNRADGGSVVQDVRTSQGAAFAKDETPLIRDITTRAANLLGIHRDNIEPLQAIRYGVGDKYLPHNDWFDPKDPGSQVALQQGGQRTKTVLVYLNTPDAGGTTSFPEADIVVGASAGNAVQFEYPTASSADHCLHGGDPVTAGEKWALNVWARERPYGTPAPSPIDGVKVVDVLNAYECATLRAVYDQRSATSEGGTDNVVRITPNDPVVGHYVKQITAHMASLFSEPMTPETIVLACMKPGVVMGNHADNVRWDGTQFVPNHTPNRTHTAVTFLNDGTGSTHYGDNPVDPFSLDIEQKRGRMHAHRCGPLYHHRVNPSDAPRYTFVVWFKAP